MKVVRTLKGYLDGMYNDCPVDEEEHIIKVGDRYEIVRKKKDNQDSKKDINTDKPTAEMSGDEIFEYMKKMSDERRAALREKIKQERHDDKD